MAAAAGAASQAAEGRARRLRAPKPDHFIVHLRWTMK
jgi:hypothetical protein